MALPLIPIAIALSIIMAVIGFLAIVDYLAIGAAVIAALFAYLKLEEYTKWGDTVNLAVSVISGFLLYKMFLGITLIVPLAVLIFATPAVIKAYVTKKIMG